MPNRGTATDLPEMRAVFAIKVDPELVALLKPDAAIRKGVAPAFEPLRFKGSGEPVEIPGVRQVETIDGKHAVLEAVAGEETDEAGKFRKIGFDGKHLRQRQLRQPDAGLFAPLLPERTQRPDHLNGEPVEQPPPAAQAGPGKKGSIERKPALRNQDSLVPEARGVAAGQRFEPKTERVFPSGPRTPQARRSIQPPADSIPAKRGEAASPPLPAAAVPAERTPGGKPEPAGPAAGRQPEPGKRNRELRTRSRTPPGAPPPEVRRASRSPGPASPRSAEFFHIQGGQGRRWRRKNSSAR